ncbi:hypothetical protein EYC80_010993 [Monilinia laxa]|uniref:Uncharacterized protein n=1 Tax=Monilinia laxa TaxID=61186 RepID=A0A5N6JPS5_MONLA|nr:hypothetical protein EYC80_010993 [Monilinia laxa]
MSAEDTALTSGETICHVTETLHGFCGHITTAFKHHSPICGSKQSLLRSGPRSGRSRSSTLSRAGSIVSTIAEKIRSRPETPRTPRSEGSNDGALARLSRALSTKASSVFQDNIRSIAESITGRRGIPDDPANTFSFSTRIPCPQLLIQPLHSPFPCLHCANIWGMGPKGARKEGTEREMTAAEGIELEKRMIRLKPIMQEWAAKMNAWDCGERVVKKGGKVMEEDSER